MRLEWTATGDDMVLATGSLFEAVTEADIEEYKRRLEPAVYRPFRGPAWEYADLAAAAGHSASRGPAVA